MTTWNAEAYSDAQGKNNITRNARQYRDLDLFFLKKGTTKDIRTVTDVLAIKRSVKHLVLTNIYEKPFHPEIGSGVRDLLFENMTTLTSIILTKKVEDVIVNFEPRVRLTGVQATPNLDLNTYELTIEFFILNAPTELQTVDMFLERLR